MREQFLVHVLSDMEEQWETCETALFFGLLLPLTDQWFLHSLIKLIALRTGDCVFLAFLTRGRGVITIEPCFVLLLTSELLAVSSHWHKGDVAMSHLSSVLGISQLSILTALSGHRFQTSWCVNDTLPNIFDSIPLAIYWQAQWFAFHVRCHFPQWAVCLTSLTLANGIAVSLICHEIWTVTPCWRFNPLLLSFWLSDQSWVLRLIYWKLCLLESCWGFFLPTSPWDVWSKTWQYKLRSS